MGVIDKLASSLGRNDEVPNQELAATIAARKDKAAVKELVELLSSKDKHIQNDCIKVLYEIGTALPELVAPYAGDFINLLHSKNNRLVWGAMTALSSITNEVPGLVYDRIGIISEASDKGSVIAKDNFMNILIKLAVIKKYREYVWPMIMEQLWQSATNQLPMYTERVLPVADKEWKQDFETILSARINDMEKDSQKKRIEKVLKKLKSL